MIGQALRWSAGCRASRVTWDVGRRPVFENSIGQLKFTAAAAVLTIEQVEPYDASVPSSMVTAFHLEL